MEELKGRRTRLLRARWLIPILLLAVIVGTVMVIKSVLGHRVQVRLNQIRAAKEPLTSGDLNSWLEFVPAADNAALGVLEAARSIVTNAPNMNHGTWGKNELSQEQLKFLSSILKTNENALDRLSLALEKPGGRYPIDWSPGPGTLLPHLSKIQSLANLLEAKARLAALETNAPLSAATIQQLLALSQTLQTEPALVSQLVRLATLSRAVSDLELLLNRSPLASEEIQQLKSAFEAVQGRKGLETAVIGERAMGVYIFSAAPSELGTILDLGNRAASVNSIALYKTSPFYEADYLHFLGISAMAVQAVKLPFPQALDAFAGIQAHASNTYSRFHLISNLCSTDYNQIINKYAYRMARCGLAIGALEVEQYWLDHEHSYPKSGGGIILQKDPFTGNPLTYKLLGAGYRIYSFGPDRKDDHGEPIQTNHAKKQEEDARQDDYADRPGDLTFTVSR